MPMPFQRITTDEPITGLLRFLAAWLRDPPAKYRIPESSIPSFVPAPLRAVYAFAGRWPERYPEQTFDDGGGNGLFQIQDSLRSVEDLAITGERLVFLDENQGNWSCETLAGADDPPVWCNRKGERELVCDRLSHFLVTFCLQELMYGSRYVVTADSVPSPTDLVRCPVEPLWLEGRFVYDKPTDVFVAEAGLLLVRQFGWWLGFDKKSARKVIVPTNGLRTIR